MDTRLTTPSPHRWIEAKWQFGEPRTNELDPELLMWWAHDRLDFSNLPDRRVVLEFRFVGEPRRFWVVRDALGPSLCTHDPGFEVDVLIEADLAVLYKVWLGRIELRSALREATVTFIGPPALVRRMNELFMLSPIAPVVAALRGPEQPSHGEPSDQM